MAVLKECINKFRTSRADRLELCHLAVPKSAIEDDDYCYFIYDKGLEEQNLLELTIKLLKNGNFEKLVQILSKCFQTVIKLKTPPCLFCPTKILINTKDDSKVYFRIGAFLSVGENISREKENLMQYFFRWSFAASPNYQFTWIQGFARYVWLLTEGHFEMPEEQSPFSQITGKGLKETWHRQTTNFLYQLFAKSLDQSSAETLWQSLLPHIESSIRIQIGSRNQEVEVRLAILLSVAFCEDFLNSEQFTERRLTSIAIEMHLADLEASNSVHLLEIKSLLSPVDFLIEKMIDQAVGDLVVNPVGYTVDLGRLANALNRTSQESNLRSLENNLKSVDDEEGMLFKELKKIAWGDLSVALEVAVGECLR